MVGMVVDDFISVSALHAGQFSLSYPTHIIQASLFWLFKCTSVAFYIALCPDLTLYVMHL